MRALLYCLLLIAALPLGAAPRVISASPVTTEIICALGAEACLIGRSSACDYPESVKKLPISGDFGTIYAEKTALLNPTLVVSTQLYRPADRKMLDALGIKYELFKDDTIEDYFVAVTRMGKLLDRQTEANKLIADGRAVLKRLSDSAAPVNPPRVLIVAGVSPLYAAGGRGYLAGAVTLAGGNNVASEFNQAFVPLSTEWVAGHRVEIILSVGHGISEKDLAALPGFAEVPAVRSNQIISGEISEALARPGPRLFGGMEKLRRYFLAASAASSAALSRENGSNPVSVKSDSNSDEVRLSR